MISWTNRFNSPVGHARRTRVGNLVHHLEHLRRALPGRGRDVEDRRVVQELQLPPQLVVEFLVVVGAPAFHQVPFVRRDDDAAARFVRLAGNGAVLVGGADSASMTRTATSAFSIARRARMTLSDSS